MKLHIVVAGVLGLTIPIPAHAYVRTTTSSGTPIAWTSDCLEFQADTLSNPAFSNERTRAALDKAIAAWNTADKGKTPFTVSRGADVSEKDVSFDHTSVVLWRLPGFCDDASHAGDEACLAPDATATTTVYFRDEHGQAGDGEILEADMELNAVHFAFDDSGSPDAVDLQSVFAHETGHAFGLDHTCFTSSGATPLLDNRGDPQLFCFPTSSLPADVTSATMFNFISPGETDKRGPTPDEVDFASTVYGDYTGTCANNDAGSASCSVAVLTVPRARWAMVLGIGILAIGTIAIRRRKRR